MFVIHSTRPDVTFHPKLYLFEGEQECSALVGSSNLTSGGLFTNMEAGCVLTQLLPNEDVAKQLKSFVASLTDLSQPHIQKLGNNNLNTLLAALPQEVTLWKNSSANKSTGGKATNGLFGAGAFPAAPALPAAMSAAASKTPASTATASSPATGPTGSAAGTALTGVPIGKITGFWKQLSPWDVAPGSSPGQIQIPKQFEPLFPQLSTQTVMRSGGKAKTTKDSTKPDEFWLQYGQWTRVNSDRGERIGHRHAFYMEKMLEYLQPLQLKDAKRIYGELEREIIYFDSSKKCAVCGAPVPWNEHEIHHLTEHSKGGPTTIENGALVHKACHPKSADATKALAEKIRAERATSDGLQLL